MTTIRNLKKEDAPRVAQLIEQLTKNIVEPENLTTRLEKMAIPENYQYFVAEVDGRVMGFAGLCWYKIPSKGLIAWVEEVVVDEAARGQGLGKELMNKLLELAKEKDCVRVRLITQNPVARQLYEKLGFIKGDESYFVKKS